MMSKNLKSHFVEFTLDKWLSYIESIHSIEIDLGLTRVNTVAQRLHIDLSFAKVVTVAGTNGKGTTCAFIEKALMSLNTSVAVYSSPHIETFNERLRINQSLVEDAELVQAFYMIEQARDEISLSYYEFTTLAAFLVLMKRKPEVIVLEVGLGGRLDATNIIDCDIAVITTIDLDHQQFLGSDRESIGFEKAGIFKQQALAIVGDSNTPKSVISHAKTLGITPLIREQHFSAESTKEHWSWTYQDCHLENLERPFIPLDNVATALMVLNKLGIDLTDEWVNNVIKTTKVAGRTELFTRKSNVMLDVGHNPQAARYLASYVSGHYPRIHAVIGMLVDKDIASVIQPLISCVDHWYVGSLSVPRGASANEIAQYMAQFDDKVNCFDNVTDAFKIAENNAHADDLILVFGSFFTVAEIRKLLV